MFYFKATLRQSNSVWFALMFRRQEVWIYKFYIILFSFEVDREEKDSLVLMLQKIEADEFRKDSELLTVR